MQAFNPYLPSWEYTPDGEPHVFGDRVYVYGSHDRFQGTTYCLNDYVCWSAPVENLKDWRYEGVIYQKTQDPHNADGSSCLYAPDVTQGPDGRYYLFYVLDHRSCVSVAVCDTPAGKYTFYGFVHDDQGGLIGEREGDEPQFDPAVITEGDITYLYTGFCGPWDKSRKGSMFTELDKDMLTVRRGPTTLTPSAPYSAGSGFEGHEFFEAPSIRKFGDTYYFVYSSVVMHELCYATSKRPDGDFVYRGVLVSNCDLHIDTYKPADLRMYYGANNHGGLVDVKGTYYIFYHRHTNGTNFCRQGMAEKVTRLPDGSIPQVEMTSCGLNGGPLQGKGTYPAYIACNLFCDMDREPEKGDPRSHGFWLDSRFPRITQEGRDGDEEPGFLINMMDSATCGYKYFDCKDVHKVSIQTRGYFRGAVQIKTAWDGKVLGEIPVSFTNIWTEGAVDVAIPDGMQALYFTFKGFGNGQLASFTLS